MGGTLDVVTELWQPLPPPDRSMLDLENGGMLPRVGGAGDWLVPGGDLIFAPAIGRFGRWHEVPVGPAGRSPTGVGVWTGTEVLAWGGYVMDGDTPVLTADGAAYTPPSAGDAPPPTTTPTTEPPDPPHTTAPTTDPPTTPPPTTSGPTTTVPLTASSTTGTYEGIEEYRLESDRCPEMEHALEADFTLADGRVWEYRADYCGVITDGIWHGEGSFVLIVPGGSTIHGTWSHSAPEGTAGEPYSITVLGGSGEYEGATGWCDLTIAVEELDFGTQGQSGTFACQVTTP
jgi:hypothetical protein